MSSYNSTLDDFCGSTFWDSATAWHTDTPELSDCFEKTVLVWIPCLYLWLASIFDAYFILNSKQRNIPWNPLNISKLTFTIMLIVLAVVDFAVAVHRVSNGMAVASVDYYTPVIKMFTLGLSATLMYYNRRFGLRTSGVLFLFWLLLIITGLPQFRTEIVKKSSIEDGLVIRYHFVSYMVYYPLTVVMFVLNCFADLPPRDTPYKYEKNQCPEIAAAFPSRLTFSWFDPLVLTGFRRPLTEKDLWLLNPEDSSREIVSKFDHYWEKSLAKKELSTATKATYRKTSANINFKPNRVRKPASILPSLCLAFGGPFLFGALLRLANDTLVFVSPQLIRLLIVFVSSDEPDWKGYVYAIAMLACATVQTFLMTQYFLRMYLVGLRIRAALTSAIYRKSLRMSNSAKKESTAGEIVNLMCVDAHRFTELTVHLNMVWSAPFQISLALYFLWDVLGASVLAGLAMMVVLIPANGLIANSTKKLQIKQMKYKDERIKLMNEVLNGIKVLKMYAWEPSFEEQILRIRNKEINVLKQIAYLNSATAFLWSCAPTLVSLMSFACYALVNDTEVLDSQKAFVALSLFNILRFPLSILPDLISNLVQTSVSVKRLNKFMNCDELDMDSVEHDDKEPNSIVIKDGKFSWDEDSEDVLKDINVSIPRGALVAVVGAVGAGKSSLLSALLGEMNKTSGRVNLNGTVAFIAQQAWIQNATLQNNITFGKCLDKHKYDDVIDVCALKPDFDVLPGGDQTEIGEKGINLSGGQKQRVSLARAVYCDADNYFLDDPLSAVDSHVGKHIFDKVIGPNGLLKHKTRVWVTHNVSYLAQTDFILVLKHGQISESGTYHQLLEKKGAFAEFLIQHLSDVERNFPEHSNEIKQDLENQLGAELQNKLQRVQSLSEDPAAVGDTPGNMKKEALEKLTQNEMKEKSKLIETEKTETASVKWSVYKHYLVSGGILASVVTLMMHLTLQVFQVGANFWLAAWSNDDKMIVNGTMDTQRRDMYLGVYGALSFGQVVSVCASSLALYIGCLRAARCFHARLLRGVLRAPAVGFFERTPAGRILNRFSKDVDVLDTGLPIILRGWTSGAFAVAGRLFVITYTSPMFLIALVPIGLVYYLIQRYYVPTSRQLKRLESVTRSPIYSHFGESITGASTIRAYGVSQRFILESERLVDVNQSCQYPSMVSNWWVSVRLETVGNLIIFLAALFVVLGRATVSAGIVGLSLTYALQITQTMNWVIRMTSQVQSNIVAVERIKEYAEITPEAPWTLEAGPRSNWPETGALELDKLTLGYRDTEPALRDVSCVVRPRDKVGIVGRTGAGKSTLTLGLFRIVEAISGRILIDGIDISKIGLHQLRSRITIIPQDPVLFSGTLRMNLDPFEAYSDGEIWRSLEHAHLKGFVQGLEAGLLHAVSEGGENLSVGQRQLVCLGRALLRRTPLLVLDEATAAVDLHTDQLIQKTIRSEFASCTVLTIAHRLNTIMDSTTVMVLDKGRLVEYAPPELLLADKDTLFYSMAKHAGLVN